MSDVKCNSILDGSQYLGISASMQSIHENAKGLRKSFWEFVEENKEVEGGMVPYYFSRNKELWYANEIQETGQAIAIVSSNFQDVIMKLMKEKERSNGNLIEKYYKIQHTEEWIIKLEFDTIIILLFTDKHSLSKAVLDVVLLQTTLLRKGMSSFPKWIKFQVILTS